MRMRQEQDDAFSRGLDEGGFGDESKKENRSADVSHELSENPEKKISQLKQRLAGNLELFHQTNGKLESLVEDEDCPAPLKERVLTSIDAVGKNMMDKFKLHFGGSSAAGGVMALYEFAANSSVNIMESGIFSGGAGSIALAGAALYAGMKGLQFARYKIQEMTVKNEVKKGTIKGMGEAAVFLHNAESQGHGRSSHISDQELQSMFDEENRIFEDEERIERRKNGGQLDTRSARAVYEKGMRRIARELSQL